MLKMLKKLFDIFKRKKKAKVVRSFDDFEVLKKKFSETRFCLSFVKLSPKEEKDANSRLQYLATEISSILGGSSWTQILADSLEEADKTPEELDKIYKGADLPTLWEEFKAVHFMMMTALRDEAGESLHKRLKFVARELAKRLGGEDFIRAVAAKMQKKEE